MSSHRTYVHTTGASYQEYGTSKSAQHAPMWACGQCPKWHRLRCVMSRLHTHGCGLVVVRPELTALCCCYSSLLCGDAAALGNFFGFSFFPGVLYYSTSKEVRTINTGLASSYFFYGMMHTLMVIYNGYNISIVHDSLLFFLKEKTDPW